MPERLRAPVSPVLRFPPAVAAAHADDDAALRSALVDFRFGPETPSGDAAASIPLTPDGVGPSREFWNVEGEVVRERRDGIEYRLGSDTVAGVVRFEDRDDDLEASVADAYRRILRDVPRCGRGAIVRMWNYLPRINDGDGEAERYKRFCAGRALAFEESGIRESAYPAASCVGSDGGEIVIAFVAADRPAVQVENPRQVSAFHYPSDYGKRSPAFSRATLTGAGDDRMLLVAGTASIRGYESVFQGDLAGQCAETLRNLDALVEAAEQHPAARGPLRAVALRAYVRQGADSAAVRSRLAEHYGPEVPLLCLRSDLCRRELLVEVEGVFRCANVLRSKGRPRKGICEIDLSRGEAGRIADRARE